MRHHKKLGATSSGPILHFYEPGTPAELTKWSNVSDIWLELVHGIGKPKSAKMERGTKVEPLLIDIYERDIGPMAKVYPKDYVAQHPEHDFAVCTPDGLAENGALFEAKTTIIYARHLWGEPLTDEVPMSYLAQCLWSCAVTGREQAHLLVAFGKDYAHADGTPDFSFQETALYVINRDRELEARMLQHAGEFWRTFVLAKHPPPVMPLENKREFTRLAKEFLEQEEAAHG